MSKPPTTENTFTRFTEIPLVSRDGDNDVYGGNSVSAAARRDRLFGGTRNNKKNDLYAAAMLGLTGGAEDSFSGLFNSTAKALTDPNASLMDRISQVGNFLQSGLLIGGLSALKAYDLYSDSKNSVLRRTADAPDGTRATAAAPDGPDVTRARAATPDAPDGPRAVAPDVPERSVTRAAAGAAEEAVEAGSRSLFGRALGALGVGARFLKRVPLLGAAITTAFVVYEVGSHAVNGRGSAAIGAAFAGAAEIGGNFIGFGAGDALREGTREAFVRASGALGHEGAFDDVHVSDIRALVEAGIELRSQFAEAAAPPPAGQQYAPVPAPNLHFVAA